MTDFQLSDRCGAIWFAKIELVNLAAALLPHSSRFLLTEYHLSINKQIKAVPFHYKLVKLCFLYIESVWIEIIINTWTFIYLGRNAVRLFRWSTGEKSLINSCICQRTNTLKRKALTETFVSLDHAYSQAFVDCNEYEILNTRWNELMKLHCHYTHTITPEISTTGKRNEMLRIKIYLSKYNIFTLLSYIPHSS